MPRGVKGSGPQKIQPEASEAEQSSAELAPDRMIRLECLRLANVPGRVASEVIDRAATFERYVIGGQAGEPGPA